MLAYTPRVLGSATVMWLVVPRVIVAVLSVLLVTSAGCGDEEPEPKTPDSATSPLVPDAAVDVSSGTPDVSVAPAPPKDTTPPEVAIALESPAATRWASAGGDEFGIPIMVADAHSGVQSVTIRWLGSPGQTVPERRVALQAAPVHHFVIPWPKHVGYVLLEVVAQDGAGLQATDRRWLIPPLKSVGRNGSAPAPVERRWELRVDAGLLTSKAFKSVVHSRVSKIRLSQFAPKHLGSAMGHSLKLARFVHSPPKLKLRLAKDGLAVTATVSDFTVNVDVTGLIDRRVTARGGVSVQLRFFGLLSAGKLTLSVVSAFANLKPFKVNFPGATNIVASRVRGRITAEAVGRVSRELRAAKPAIEEAMTAVYTFALGGAGSLKRRLNTTSGRIRPSGLEVRGELAPIGRTYPRRAIFASCPAVPSAARPAKSPTKTKGAKGSAKPSAASHITTRFHVEQFLTAMDDLYEKYRVKTAPALVLPFGNVTIEAPLPPLALGCLEPESPALWFQLAGVRVRGRIGSGFLAAELDAELAATVKVEFRSKGGRLQARVQVVWLWTSLGLLGNVLAGQLTPLADWGDLPTLPLPHWPFPPRNTTTSKPPPAVLRVARLEVDGRKVTLGFDLEPFCGDECDKSKTHSGNSAAPTTENP